MGKTYLNFKFSSKTKITFIHKTTKFPTQMKNKNNFQCVKNSISILFSASANTDDDDEPLNSNIIFELSVGIYLFSLSFYIARVSVTSHP